LIQGHNHGLNNLLKTWI